MAQLVKNLPIMQEDLGLIPGLERSPGEEKGYSLQYSGLQNSMDCSPLGSSVHEISQAGILEWAAISSSIKCNS